MPNKFKRRILLLSLGGTIAMRPGLQGAVPTLNANDLMAACPGLSDWVELSVRSIKNVPIVELRLEDLAALAADIGQSFASGVDGVVVTQGTDILEETAWMLSAAADDLDQVGAGGVDYQSLFGLALLGWAWLRMATIACQQDPSSDFFAHKLHTAAFFFSRLNANMDMHARLMRAGAHVVMAPYASYF